MLFISSIFAVNFPIMAEVPPGPMNLSSKQKACLDEYSDGERPKPEEMEKLFDLCGIDAPKHKPGEISRDDKKEQTEADSLEDCDCEEESMVLKNAKQIEELLEKIEDLEEKNERLAKKDNRESRDRKRNSRRNRDEDDEEFEDEDRPSRRRSNANRENGNSILDNIYIGYRSQYGNTNLGQSSFPQASQNFYYNPQNPYAYAMTDLMGGGMGSQMGMSAMNMNSSMGMGMGMSMGANMGMGMTYSGGSGMGYTGMPNYSMMNYGNYSSYPSYYNYPTNNYASGGMSFGLGASFGAGTGMGYSYYGY